MKYKEKRTLLRKEIILRDSTAQVRFVIPILSCDTVSHFSAVEQYTTLLFWLQTNCRRTCHTFASLFEKLKCFHSNASKEHHIATVQLIPRQQKHVSQLLTYLLFFLIPGKGIILRLDHYTCTNKASYQRLYVVSESDTCIQHSHSQFQVIQNGV